VPIEVALFVGGVGLALRLSVSSGVAQHAVVLASPSSEVLLARHDIRLPMKDAAMMSRMLFGCSPGSAPQDGTDEGRAELLKFASLWWNFDSALFWARRRATRGPNRVGGVMGRSCGTMKLCCRIFCWPMPLRCRWL